MKKLVPQVLAITFFSVNFALGQYNEKFDLDGRGILSPGCYGSDLSTCSTINFADVTWTLGGDLSGVDTEGFSTNGGALVITDSDGQVCWVSPLLNINIGSPVSFEIDMSWSGYDYHLDAISDYIDIKYSIDEGSFVPMPNAAGGGTHTVEYTSLDNNSGSFINHGVSNITGGKLQIQVCFFNTSSTDQANLERVEVKQTGVTILPIELISFSGKVTVEKHIQLYWETASEIDNDFIAVQRSSDGITFTEIGRVAAHGNSEQLQSYQFTDRRPLTGINYYRLRQVDFAGTEHFHSIIGIELEQDLTTRIRMSPNPVHDWLVMSTGHELKGAGQIQLFDLTGRKVAHSTWPERTREKSMALGDLPAGIYLLQVMTGAQTTTQRIMKE